MVGTLRFAHPTGSRFNRPRLTSAAGIEGATNMAFKNFKLETDADGIALVTWDIPGRSMQVLDATSTTEPEELLKHTTADAAATGVVITTSKEAFCAGADLSMLDGTNKETAK